MAATANKPYRWDAFVQSKDGKTQARIVLDDALHLLTWGRLRVSSHQVEGADLIEVADPEAWIRDQRSRLPVIEPDSWMPFSERYIDRSPYAAQMKAAA